ncbi:MAG: glycosyltransferase family 2 protein [Bacteroidales bacterium]|nr:glycosyltransferase family 2 protein [Bacteroidales bacterium]
MVLSIIIPVYNESAYIKNVIDLLYKIKFPSCIDNFELIIVDDASIDKSFKIVEQIAQQKKEIKLIGHLKNTGKGSAVKTALKAVQGDLIIVQDADLELSPYDIPLMINYLVKNKLEMVNGSRFKHKFRLKENSNLRNIANMFFSTLTSIIIGKKITDLTCGYKLFTKNLKEAIGELKENEFGIEAELLIKAVKYNKLKVAEYPVSYSPREIEEGKKIRAIDGFSILRTIFKYGLK